MKRILSVLAVLVLCAAAPLAMAQGKATAAIPFEFSVGDKLMPAGNYEVSKISQFTILVQNREDHNAAIVSAYLARRFWPGESALDKRICLYCTPERPDNWKRVIGSFCTSSLRSLCGR